VVNNRSILHTILSGYAYYWVPLLAGSFVFLLYLITMPKGLTWDLGGADGGELATAVYLKGIAHPPGYPTYILLSQLATLLPFASFAYRLNIFSALCSAAATALLTRIAMNFVGRQQTLQAAGVGLLCGVIFGLLQVVWTQAIITEVYALAALFCASVLGLTFWLESRFTVWRLALLLVAVGLGLGSHYMIVLMWTFAVIYLALRSTNEFLQIRNLQALGGLVLGLSVFLYIPLRAGSAPVISNWGNPDTIERFWALIIAADYTDRFSVALTASRFLSLFGVLLKQMSIVGVALAALGLSAWWETHRQLLYATLITITGNFLIVAGYDSIDILPYLYPTLILLTLAAGYGAYILVFVWLPEGSVKSGIAYAGILVVICVLLGTRGLKLTQQATTEAEVYGYNVVVNAPRNSLIVSNQEVHSFALRYASAVSVQRSDVIPIDIRLLRYDWFRDDLTQIYPELELTESAPNLGWLRAVPRDTTVIFTYNADVPSGYELIPRDDGQTYLLRPLP